MHVMIVLREMVALEAERANPQLTDIIDLNIRAEKGSASAAAKRGVRKQLLVREPAKGRVDGSHGYNAFAGFHFGAWPFIECKSDPILTLLLCKICHA